MALDTHPHPPILIRQSLQILNLPVTFPAGDLGVDMSLMIEQHMLGYIIYLDPGGGSLGVEVLVLLLDLRVSLNDVIVAVQTLFHRRDAREI